MTKSPFLKRQMASLSEADRGEVKKLAHQIIDTNRLAILRAKVGLTQAKLAELLSVKQASIAQIEKRSDLRLSTLLRYAQALGGQVEVRVKIPKHADVVLTTDVVSV